MTALSIKNYAIQYTNVVVKKGDFQGACGVRAQPARVASMVTRPGNYERGTLRGKTQADHFGRGTLKGEPQAGSSGPACADRGFRHKFGAALTPTQQAAQNVHCIKGGDSSGLTQAWQRSACSTSTPWLARADMKVSGYRQCPAAHTLQTLRMLSCLLSTHFRFLANRTALKSAQPQ